MCVNLMEALTVDDIDCMFVDRKYTIKGSGVIVTGYFVGIVITKDLLRQGGFYIGLMKNNHTDYMWSRAITSIVLEEVMDV